MSKSQETYSKKEKEKKTSVCVFLLLFSSFLQAKKKFVSFTKHTDIKYQIPHHHSFVARERKHTHIYIYYYHI